MNLMADQSYNYYIPQDLGVSFKYGLQMGNIQNSPSH